MIQTIIAITTKANPEIPTNAAMRPIPVTITIPTAPPPTNASIDTSEVVSSTITGVITQSGTNKGFGMQPG